MPRRTRASLPIVTVALAAAIATVYGLELAGNGIALCERFGLVPANPSFGTALTSIFLHDPQGIAHVGGNLAVLVLVGSQVEQAIGPWRFLAVFLAGGLAGAALHVGVDPTSAVPLVGASGSLFGVLAVAATVFGPAMLAFVVVLVATNIAHAFGWPGDDAISFACHLGGFFAGAAAVMIARTHRANQGRAIAA